MPKNYFINRENRSMDSSKVKDGDYVFIVTKEDQGIKDFSKLHLVKIIRTLSHGRSYKNGFKVNGQEVDKGDFDWDNYYKNCILKFNDPNNKIDMSMIEKAYEYLKNAPLTDNYFIGRIQYIALPEHFTPKPEITYIKLGLVNNIECDTNALDKQLEYIKSNYYIDCSNYDDEVAKLRNYRNLSKIMDGETLKQVNIYPNHCILTIEDNRFVKGVKYIENINFN